MSYPGHNSISTARRSSDVKIDGISGMLSFSDETHEDEIYDEELDDQAPRLGDETEYNSYYVVRPASASSYACTGSSTLP